MSEESATVMSGGGEPPSDDGGGAWEIAGAEKNGKGKVKAGEAEAAAIKTRLKNAGAKEVKTRQILVTAVMLEFNITTQTTKFNPRPKHIEFLQLVKAIDPEMAIESVSHDTEWNNPTEIPLAEEYKENSNVQDRNPPRQARKIVVHFTMKTKHRVNFIKHEPSVMQFLKANKIWFVHDKFQMQKVSRVGSLIEIHPDLVWKDRVQNDMITSLENTAMPKVEIEKWRKQTGQNDNEDETEEEDCTPVPHFTIQAKNLAFGGLITRVLQIECAEIDALYLKSLCGTCATQENFQHGTFLPQGIHLMSSPDTYKHLIADQNEYLNDIVNIPVIGLPNEIFSVDVKNEDGETLNDVIHESELFVSVEATPRTHDLGKFHFLTCKANEEEAALWIDQNLAKWESKYLPEKYKLTGFEYPKRTSMNFASPGLMLYAATLKREVHERDRPVNKDFMKAPDTNKRRRTYLEVSFGKDEFPVIEGKKNKPAKPTPERSNTQTNNAPTEK